MRILLIGGSGFLGQHILHACLKTSNAEVIAIAHKTKIDSASNLRIATGGIQAVTKKFINDVKPDIVIHAARPSFPKFRRFGRILASFKAAGLNRNLIRNLSSSNSRPPLIFASGTLCYGNNENTVYENAPLNPISYARDYFRGEKPVLQHLENGNYPIKVLRFPWLLGNGSWFKWFYLKSITQNASVPLFSEGENKMAILDVRDAALLTLAHIHQAPFNRVYNIFGNKALRQIDFLNTLADTLNCEVKPIEGKLEKAAIEAFTSSIEPGSLYPELLDNHSFHSLKQSIEDIRAKRS